MQMPPKPFCSAHRKQASMSRAGMLCASSPQSASKPRRTVQPGRCAGLSARFTSSGPAKGEGPGGCARARTCMPVCRSMMAFRLWERSCVCAYSESAAVSLASSPMRGPLLCSRKSSPRSAKPQRRSSVAQGSTSRMHLRTIELALRISVYLPSPTCTRGLETSFTSVSRLCRASSAELSTEATSSPVVTVAPSGRAWGLQLNGPCSAPNMAPGALT
mmetsp:Transcript_15914/g.48142  ORF Transcript_15914/g.48142 Transcript_15914/m.48142 type:complete len:217 (+) Transcript_15914:129-779(+)